MVKYRSGPVETKGTGIMSDPMDNWTDSQVTEWIIEEKRKRLESYKTRFLKLKINQRFGSQKADAGMIGSILEWYVLGGNRLSPAMEKDITEEVNFTGNITPLGEAMKAAGIEVSVERALSKSLEMAGIKVNLYAEQ